MRANRFWSNFLIGVGVLVLLLAGAGIAWRATSFRNAPVQGSAQPTATWPVVANVVATQTSTRAQPLSTLTPTPVPTTPIESGATTAPSATFAKPSPSATKPLAPERGPSLTATATMTIIATSPTLIASPTPTLDAATPQAPRIVISGIGVNAGIVSVSWHVAETSDGVIAEWDVAPQDLVGHHVGTANPGEKGNLVLAGHGSEGASLARLSELGLGDLITIYASETEVYRYRVVETTTLPEVGAALSERLANASYMAPTDDARLTLISCWPAWAYTHRLVVIARLESP